MMTSHTTSNKEIILQAAEWAEELDHGKLTPEQRKELAAWLLKSPVHVNELLLATTVFAAWEEVDQDVTVSIEDLLAEKAPDVIPLVIPASRAKQKQIDNPPFWQQSRAIAASLFAVIIVTAYFLLAMDDPSQKQESQFYATVTGEQRSLKLEDGSVVHMNTATKLEINYQEKQRGIRLLEGEAMFEVARDTSRPFKVFAGTATAEALGTTFNIYKQENQTVVSVIEGIVAVETTAESSLVKASKTRLTITDDERAAIQGDGKIKVSPIENIETVTSWKMRKLVFERATLSDIIKEYNRYNLTQIHLNDPKLTHTKFSGIFSVDDPDTLIKFLEKTTGLVANRDRDKEIHLLASKK